MCPPRGATNLINLRNRNLIFWRNLKGAKATEKPAIADVDVRNFYFFSPSLDRSPRFGPPSFHSIPFPIAQTSVPLKLTACALGHHFLSNTFRLTMPVGPSPPYPLPSTTSSASANHFIFAASLLQFSSGGHHQCHPPIITSRSRVIPDMGTS